MAMIINSSPILVGECARIFIEEAERNGKLPTSRLSAKREEELREIFAPASPSNRRIKMPKTLLRRFYLECNNFRQS